MPPMTAPSAVPMTGFNPRPSLPRGDAPPTRTSTRPCACFNPRPSLPRGDARDGGRPRRDGRVSIHAPRCRGAMLGLSNAQMWHYLFQSTPLVAEGRCLTAGVDTQDDRLVSIHAPRCRGAMRSAPTLVSRKILVSIHAPRCRGAMPYCAWYDATGVKFQSTPLVAEGRCGPPTSRPGACSCFNPRPSLPRGDAAPAWSMARSAPGFNPRPSLPRGDATRRPASARRLSMFQSTPLVAEGRCLAARLTMYVRKGFNPRPSLPRGDAAAAEMPPAEIIVSIHAPRCRGAMPRRRGRQVAVDVVSIHAPRCRGAMRVKALDYRTLSKFQSTPLVAEGRCVGGGAGGHVKTVSIHAPRCRGAMLSHCCCRAATSGFNPRPSLPRGDALGPMA